MISPQGCAKSLEKERRVETRRRFVAESTSLQLIEPEVLGSFTTSTLMSEVVDWLTGDVELTLRDLIVMRDRLMLHIFAVNFCPMGAKMESRNKCTAHVLHWHG